MEIQYSDLFSPNIPSEIETLIAKIKSVGTAMDEMVANVQAKAKSLGDALAGTSSASKGGRDNTQQQAAQAEALYQSYTQLKEATAYLKTNLEALTNVQRENNKVVKLLTTSNDKYADALERIKAQAELASVAIGKMGTNGNAAELKTLTQTVKTLEGQVKNLEKALSSQEKTSKSNTNSTSNHKKELLSLEQAYASLTPLIEQTGVNLNTLITTEKAHQQVSKNGEVANNSLVGSYNQLYAQYNLIKTALNSMSAEMRNSTEVGKVWEAQALDIMNQMKAMQEATGKHTLSVGNYEKAFNGLNIATQQVLREMPTLANSVQQFFIAISNNVPIFVDNFKRAQEELGGFTKAVGATMKAVFSWQTALLVLLTILPKIAKAIHDKRKAQAEANKETKEAVTLEKLLAEAEISVEKAIAQDSVKLLVLTEALEDNTRSIEDRTKASRALKSEFEDELANFTEEQIVAGEAKEALDQLTESIKAQAQARAIMNKMVEYYDKIIDNEATIKAAQDNYDLAKSATAAAQAHRDYVYTLNNMGEAYGHVETALSKAKEAEQEALDKLNAARKESQAWGDAINDLYKQIDLDGLITKTERSGRKVREAIIEALDIPDYYFELLQTKVDLIGDTYEKELEQFDLNFKIQKAARQQQMDELEEMEEELQNRIAKAKSESDKKMWEAELAFVREQIKNMGDIILNEEKANGEARVALEADIAKRKFDARVKGVQDAMGKERGLRDKEAYEHYETEMGKLDVTKDNTEQEIKLKEELNAALLDSEKKYWKDYLAQLRAEGLLTVEEYNKIMEQIASFNTAKMPKESSTRTSTRKKRGSKNFRNLTEVAFAYSDFGETVEDENGNKVRKIQDQYMDFASAINDALQTSIDYMDEWMDKRIEMAELAVEKAQEEADAAKTALDYEMQARANGYANNVELARREYEEKKQMEQEALAEQKRLQQVQEGINTAQQIGSLITATANLWSAYSAIPFAGPGLAIAATALMWGSFLASKIQAAQMANSVTHGEGMAEYLDYGNSHASGHDIDFGHTKDGRRRRVEKGEVVGVINKKNVQKYGVERVLDIIRSLNNGTYEDKSSRVANSSRVVNSSHIANSSSVTQNVSNRDYVSRVITSSELIQNLFGDTTPENEANLAFMNAKIEDMLRGGESGSTGLKIPFMGNSESLGANYASAFDGLREIADLSLLERGMDALIRQGETRVVQTAEGRIEYRGNNKRIIRNG